jgi:hypothetical protein
MLLVVVGQGEGGHDVCDLESRADEVAGLATGLFDVSAHGTVEHGSAEKLAREVDSGEEEAHASPVVVLGVLSLDVPVERHAADCRAGRQNSSQEGGEEGELCDEVDPRHVDVWECPELRCCEHLD